MSRNESILPEVVLAKQDMAVRSVSLLVFRKGSLIDAIYSTKRARLE